MSNPTPGPWYLRRDAVPDWHAQYTISDQSGDRVATAFQSEATARLITAAPDLLAACQAFQRQCTDAVRRAMGAEYDAVARQVWDAIAKTTG